MVVHCSAGIGRTGAFIVIDSMLRMAEKEKKIDVLGHFCRIRLQRMNMVEKFAQYRFVYQVLLEALSHEPTDVSCKDFATYLDKLTKGTDKASLLYKQYEVRGRSCQYRPTYVCTLLPSDPQHHVPLQALLGRVQVRIDQLSVQPQT